MNIPRIFDRRPLLILLSALLTLGFTAVSLIGYEVSRRSAQQAIVADELPLISSNIYSEIQKDLIRPILISSTMAHDTFLRDWILGGETDAKHIANYLREVRERYKAFSSFLVSDRSSNYYTGDGLLKQVKADEPRDGWYYRVKQLTTDYEINVDRDLANHDALTIFVNYRVFDFSGRYIGATGIGLTVDSVKKLIEDYQRRFKRTIYFVDEAGHIVLSSGEVKHPTDLNTDPAIGALLPKIRADKRGSYQFDQGGHRHLVNVNYLPELKWYLHVEMNETTALSGLQHTLWINLAISLMITIVVTSLIHMVITRFQRRLETMASTDKLTGLLNRHAFTILINKALADYRRDPHPICVLMIDLDHFKKINDQHGHLIGDAVLAETGKRIHTRIRESDHAVRWGGEEFLVLLRDCEPKVAEQIANELRESVQASPVKSGQKSVPFTISIGVAGYDGEETVDQLIDRADNALYLAKQQGRDHVVLSVPLGPLSALPKSP